MFRHVGRERRSATILTRGLSAQLITRISCTPHVIPPAITGGCQDTVSVRPLRPLESETVSLYVAALSPVIPPDSKELRIVISCIIAVSRDS